MLMVVIAMSLEDHSLITTTTYLGSAAGSDFLESSSRIARCYGDCSGYGVKIRSKLVASADTKISPSANLVRSLCKYMATYLKRNSTLLMHFDMGGVLYSFIVLVFQLTYYRT